MPTIEEILEFIQQGYMSFSELPPKCQFVMATTLRPNGIFTDEQKDLMGEFFLEVSEELPDPPVGFGWPTLEISGKTYLPCHLLTDIRPGENWWHVADFLVGLKIVHLGPVSFSEVGTDE